MSTFQPTFLNWATGGKDSQQGCVQLKTVGYDTGAWASENCDNTHAYVCRMGAGERERDGWEGGWAGMGDIIGGVGGKNGRQEDNGDEKGGDDVGGAG